MPAASPARASPGNRTLVISQPDKLMLNICHQRLGVVNSLGACMCAAGGRLCVVSACLCSFSSSSCLFSRLCVPAKKDDFRSGFVIFLVKTLQLEIFSHKM